MEALLLFFMAAANITCFVIGAKIGQAVSKGETIETPSINPLEAYRKHEAKKVAQREQEKIDAIMRNIESYDGTERGQEDVPR